MVVVRVVVVAVLMSHAVPAVAVAAAVVEVWPEYPLPQFEQLTGQRRAAALFQARNLRHQWAVELHWHGIWWFPAELAQRRAQAIYEAAWWASLHISRHNELLYYYQNVWGARNHLAELPCAAPAA